MNPEKTIKQKRSPLRPSEKNIFTSPIIANFTNGKLLKSPTPIFKITPTQQMLDARKIPQKLIGKPRIIGNSEQVEILFNHIKNVGKLLFTPQFFSSLFPKSLSQLYNYLITTYNNRKSRIPQSRLDNQRVTNPPNFFANTQASLNLSHPFQQIKRMMRIRKSQILAITDFLLLYFGFIIIVGDDDNKVHSLTLLKTLLNLGIPSRPDEFSILFAITIKQGNTNEIIHNLSVDILKLLSELDQNIFERVQTGSMHHDDGIKSLCIDVLSKLNPEMIQQEPPNEEETSDGAINFLIRSEEMFENGEPPSNVLEFIYNVIHIMQIYPNVSTIFEKGSKCLMIVLSLCEEFPIDMISEILNICFSILSGDQLLEGENSFNAAESIQLLTNYIFDLIPSDILIKSIALVISISTDSRLNLILNKLQEYVNHSETDISQQQLDEINASLDRYHPDFVNKPSFLLGSDIKDETILLKDISNEELEDSINRLKNGNTVFIEMETIVKKYDPIIILKFPLYLRGFLIRAFVMYGIDIPFQISNDEHEMIQKMKNYCIEMNEVDLEDNGKFGLNTLSQSLIALKK